MVKEVFEKLEENNISIASAESATGGFFIYSLILNPGASKFVKGSVVSYTDEIKQNILKVPKKIISEKTSISEEVSKQMAVNIRKLYKTDIGISFTGNAGPQDLGDIPVGTFYISVASKLGVESTHFITKGSRESIIQDAVNQGFFLINSLIKELK